MTAAQEIDFIEWRERMIVGLADRMPHDGGVTVSGKEVARSLGMLESNSWLDSLRRELEEKKWAYVDWDMDDPDDVGFEVYGEGLLEAARIRRALAMPAVETKASKIDWAKWGGILTGLGILVAIFIAVFD
jgi:hypothetical protein